MSMSPLQEVIARYAANCMARGGYPKPVVMPIGVIAFAKNEEEYRKLQRQSDIGHGILGGVVIFIGVATIIFMLITAFNC